MQETATRRNMLPALQAITPGYTWYIGSDYETKGHTAMMIKTTLANHVRVYVYTTDSRMQIVTLECGRGRSLSVVNYYGYSSPAATAQAARASVAYLCD